MRATEIDWFSQRFEVLRAEGTGFLRMRYLLRVSTEVFDCCLPNNNTYKYIRCSIFAVNLNQIINKMIPRIILVS